MTTKTAEAKAKKSAIKMVKPGDTLYMWKSASFLNKEEKRELKEVVVSKANTASIYVVKNELDYRFDKKTMQLRDGFGGYYELFIDPNEFYERWDKKQEIFELRRAIHKFTDSASHDILKQVHDLYSKGLQK